MFLLWLFFSVEYFILAALLFILVLIFFNLRFIISRKAFFFWKFGQIRMASIHFLSRRNNHYLRICSSSPRTIHLIYRRIFISAFIKLNDRVKIEQYSLVHFMKSNFSIVRNHQCTHVKLHNFSATLFHQKMINNIMNLNISNRSCISSQKIIHSPFLFTHYFLFQ